LAFALLYSDAENIFNNVQNIEPQPKRRLKPWWQR
jgi:hypothetical protein